MPARLRLSCDMKTWKLFFLSVLESLEFGWQVNRYALIFVSAFFRQRASLGCAMVAMRSQLTFYKESIRVSPLVGVAVHGVSAPTFRGMASRSQSSTSSQSAQQQPNMRGGFFAPIAISIAAEQCARACAGFIACARDSIGLRAIPRVWQIPGLSDQLQ